MSFSYGVMAAQEIVFLGSVGGMTAASVQRTHRE